MFKRLLLGLLLVTGAAWADKSSELPAGGSIDSSLVKGKTNIVEFYADW